MTTEINAGRVAMVPKGEWSSSTAYSRLDVVQYNGSSYVAIQDSTGQNPSTATTYWQLLAGGVDSSNYYTKNETNTKLGGKQDALVSGQNIKSINGHSVLGEGNLELGELFVVRMTRNNSNSVYTADKSVSEIYEASYTNGKPVIAVMRDINNPVFILTDCDPDGDSYVFSSIESNSVTTLRWQQHADDYTYELETIVLQPHLVSGTNIKSVNNESLLGSGNVTISGKSAYQSYVDTTTDSPVKTEAEWVASLKGEDGVSLGEVAIADNLTTDDAAKVLSARQGYLLGQKVNGVDDVPTAGSEKFVKSGGVFDELVLGAVYDVSAKNPTAGINNDGKWESLSALLSDVNLNTLIPGSVRKGGMSVKFVQSSDNKYVQYRLTTQNWSNLPLDWINIEEGVKNLENYTSEVIGYPQKSINLENFEKRNGLINNGVWALLDNSSYKHIFLPVKGGQKYRFVAATPYNRITYAFLISTTEVEGESPNYCEGYSAEITRQAPQYDVLLPDDCNYLYVYAQGGPTTTLPTSCTLLATDGTIQQQINDLNSNVNEINDALDDKLSIVEQSLSEVQKETTLNNVGVSDTDSFFDLFKTAKAGYSEMVINSTISGKFITSNGALSDYALYVVRVYDVSGIDKIHIKENRNSTELARVYAFYSDAECTSVVGEVGPAYSTLEIDLEIDVPADANYIGVSYRENVTSLYQVLQDDKTTLLKKIIRIAESSSQIFGICKISRWYFHFVRKNGGKYIIREFLNEGINNLFFLEAIHIGHITDEGVVIESTIQEAYRTDNIGPVMISNPVLFPGEDGGWSGGAHGKTIDNVEYPTAEQDSLSILCDGVSVSENGMYFGEVTITAKNKLYFPESITGDDLSSATLALNERIEIVLNEKMNVRVIEEAASNDVYISRYYGLQGIRIGFNEMYLLGNNLHITFADMATDLYLSHPERKIMMYNNNLHYDLTLKDIGLGMVNNTSRHYYGFFPVSARKVYFMLIDTYGGVQPYVLESGKVIGWEGIYDVYFD